LQISGRRPKLLKFLWIIRNAPDAFAGSNGPRQIRNPSISSASIRIAFIQFYGTKRAEVPAPESLLSIERLSDSWCSGPAEKIARC